MIGTFHTPVMVDEVRAALRPVAGRGTFVDATLGGGGHACALIEEMSGSMAQGTLLGIDVDREAIAAARQRLELAGFVVDKADDEGLVMVRKTASGSCPVVWLVRANYVELAAVVRRLELLPVAAVLFDLGVSLHQLVTPERGFSFDRDGPIDMRFDQSSGKATALSLLRRASEPELRRWLADFGQEPRSRRIARAIHERRHELRTTQDIATIVRRIAGGRMVRKTLARVFQAIRIVTNQELEAVRRGLQSALDVLTPGGRLAVIAYHSGEDRIAKEFLREGSRSGRLRVV
ncbi:MAG: 16S rRNA (cytosine(1402)-N(4))-methyltransferase RsmH, partial [candidate division WOR-3 bacterium]